MSLMTLVASGEELERSVEGRCSLHTLFAL